MTKTPTHNHILVTGGAGFIGSHLVELLLSSGAYVTILDNFSTGRLSNLSSVLDHPRLIIQESDVSQDLEIPLRTPIRTFGPFSHVAHLAAQTSVIASLNNPLADAHTNHIGMLRVLEFARSQHAHRVVFSSSAAIYGDVPEQSMPVGEDFSPAPLSPYGVHKLSSESLCRMYSLTHALPTSALRFFNIYGPRQDPKSPYSGVITVFAQKALSGEQISIFGDGTQTRDFVFVSDVVHALSAALFSPKTGFQSLNVGTGLETSINTLAQSILDLSQEVLPTPLSQPPILHAPPRLGEILRSCAQNQKLSQELNFTPQTPLKFGLKKTLSWLYQQQK